MSSEERIEAAMKRYIDRFDCGLPVGFSTTELDNPNDPDEWDRLIDEAIKYDEPFDYCCEGVFDEEEIMEQERLRASRKARIAKAKGEA